ncbi:hypothetical protein TNCV_1543721 [Trichonephila clavipes]|nr:hypothetical protein TNCV_1543721 [Trichonephila clavipes]
MFTVQIALVAVFTVLTVHIAFVEILIVLTVHITAVRPYFVGLCPGSSTSASSVRSLNSNLHNNLRYRGVESDLRVSLVSNGLVGPYSATVLVTLPSAPDHRPPRLASAR